MFRKIQMRAAWFHNSGPSAELLVLFWHWLAARVAPGSRAAVLHWWELIRSDLDKVEKQSALTSTASRAVRKCERRLGWWGQDCTACRSLMQSGLFTETTLSCLPPQLASITPSSRTTNTQLHVPRSHANRWRFFRASRYVLYIRRNTLFSPPRHNLLTLFFKWDVIWPLGVKDREAKCAVHTYTCCCHVERPRQAAGRWQRQTGRHDLMNGGYKTTCASISLCQASLF